MKHLLHPDYDFDTYLGVTPEFLKKIGVKVLLCDIDNTLAPYEMATPDENIVNWVNSLKKENIKLCFVSNNGKERVELFAKDLDVPYIWKSGKPLRRSVKNSLPLVGGEKDTCAILGDQLLTDVLTARFSGIISLYVPSIKKVNTPFFKFKSAIEKPFIRSYYRKKGKNK